MRYGRLFGRTAPLLLGAWAATVVAAASPDPESAVWVPHDFTFTYKAFTTKYSCDSLRAKMKEVLLKLGARADLQVRTTGCTHLSGPDPLPGVYVKMHVLQPAAAQSAQSVPATWKPVDFVTNRDPTEVAGECELMSQIAREVLPLFATREVQANTTCVPRTLTIGTTELKADVLVAEADGSRSAAR